MRPPRSRSGTGFYVAGVLALAGFNSVESAADSLAAIEAERARLAARRASLELERGELAASVSTMLENRPQRREEVRAQLESMDPEDEGRRRIFERMLADLSAAMPTEHDYRLRLLVEVELPELEATERRLQARTLALSGEREGAAVVRAETDAELAGLRVHRLQLDVAWTRELLRQAEWNLEYRREQEERNPSRTTDLLDRELRRCDVLRTNLRAIEIELSKSLAWSERRAVELAIARQGGAATSVQEAALGELETRLGEIEAEERRHELEAHRVQALHPPQRSADSRRWEALSDADFEERVAAAVGSCLTAAEAAFAECPDCRGAILRYIETVRASLERCRAEIPDSNEMCAEFLDEQMRVCGLAAPAYYKAEPVALEPGFENRLEQRYGCHETAVAADEHRTTAIVVGLPGILERARAAGSSLSEQISVGSERLSVTLVQGRWVGPRCTDVAMASPYDSWEESRWTAVEGTALIEMPEIGSETVQGLWVPTTVRLFDALLQSEDGGEFLELGDLELEVVLGGITG